MTMIERGAWLLCPIAALAGCAVPADQNIAASDVASRAAAKDAAAIPDTAPPTPPRPVIKRSPWQPEAEVDPVPPPVEGDEPAS